MDKSTISGSIEGDGGIGNYTNSSQNAETLKHQSWPCTSNTGERRNFKRAANRGKKGSQVLSDISCSTVRVLRSTSSAKQPPSDVVVQPDAKKSPDTVHTLVQPAAKRIKRSRPAVRALDNELSKFRQRIRYILNRMNYEQSLLEAYASEGWKRQSLEKIRPEMELERAKAEILRCKLRIREAFQNLDRLLSAGKLEESLFDSEGNISCEDIFCATCGLQNITLNNDIILCDGVCDRGFHQKCLKPPLLTKDIPVGDEGWLCPACVCKIDCIDAINDLQGTDLSLSDSWEKFFPEAVALAHGSKQSDVSDLPSDDSEDNDFDPNIAEEYVSGHDEGSSDDDADEGSDSDDSNLITSSDNSEHLKDKEKVDDLGLPSEDSEDDDYDPAGPDSDKDIEEKHNESDFTSDSDDFCAEIAKSCGSNEVSSAAKSGDPTNDSEEATFQVKTAMSNPISKNPQMDQDVALPVSGRRQVQRLDYKKLYDDAYGEAPSDSSDDEEWSGKSTPEKGNEEQNEMDLSLKTFKETGAVQQNNELTPHSARQNLHKDGFHGSVNGEHARELTSNGGKNNTTQRRQFGLIINQRLHDHFKTDQYPSRTVKESLAEELGLALGQVSKWFESKRRHTRVLANKNGTHLEYCNTNRNKSSVIDPNEGMIEKSNVCKDRGIKQDDPVKQDSAGGQRIDAPAESIQSYATTSGILACPKGESGENHGKNNSSRYVGRPNYGSVGDHILGLSPEAEVSDSDDPNFVTSSGNAEPLKEKEKVDELGLPSEDSEEKEKVDPVGHDSDIDIKRKKSSSDDPDFTSDFDFSSDSDDFCAEIAKSCGQEGVSSGAIAGGCSIDDLEGTTLRGNTSISDLPSKVLELDQNVDLKAPSNAKDGGDPVHDLEGTKLEANTTISNLPSKDLEMDQDVFLPVSGRRQKGAHGETSSGLSDYVDLPGKSTPEKENMKHSEAGSFSRKCSSGTGAVHQSYKSTQQNAQQSLHHDAFHGSVNAHDAQEVLTPNDSNSATQRKYEPIISQRLHEHFKIDQYPCRAVKESLAQELGLTFRQVSKWFETTRHSTRVAASKNSSHLQNHSTRIAASKNGSHLQNHSTNGNKSSVTHSEVADTKEMMAEKLNVCKNVNEGIQQDSPQKPEISDAQQSLHHDVFHGSVNARDTRKVLTRNGRKRATQRKYDPIIRQRLHEHFKIDQYSCRTEKKILARELGLTLRQVDKWFETTRRKTRVAAIKNGSHLQDHSTDGSKSSIAHTEVSDSKEMIAEKLNVCKNVSGGIQQDSPQKPEISDGLRARVTPPDSCQRYATTSGLVGCPKGESRYNNKKSSPSRYAAIPKDGHAEVVVLALEAVVEGAKEAALRDLKKRKTD